MSNMARLVRDQVSRVMSNVRQAFRGTAARNTHGTVSYTHLTLPTICSV